jgi:hypothetical protein
LTVKGWPHSPAVSAEQSVQTVVNGVNASGVVIQSAILTISGAYFGLFSFNYGQNEQLAHVLA